MTHINEIKIEGVLAKITDEGECFRLNLLKNDKVVGSAYLVPEQNKEIIELDRLFTPFPGKGYGKAMVEAAKIFAKESNYRGIFTKAFPELERFFLKCGLKKSPISEGLSEYFLSFQ